MIEMNNSSSTTMSSIITSSSVVSPTTFFTSGYSKTITSTFTELITTETPTTSTTETPTPNSNTYDYYEYNITYELINIKNKCMYPSISEYVKVFYIILFILGLLGNVAVVTILFCKKIKTITDIYIFNLAMSDMIFVVDFPFIIYNEFDQWIFGDFMCKVISASYYIGFFSNMFLITLMSIDRYFAILYPISFQKYRTFNIGITLTISSWILVLIITVPAYFMFEASNIVFTAQNSNETISNYQCTLIMDNQKNNMVLLGRILQFEINILGMFIPIIIFVFCYLKIILKLKQLKKSKKTKSIIIVSVIVICSLICWMPLNVVTLFATMYSFKGFSSIISEHICGVVKLGYAMMLAEAVSLTHCCINPLIYTLIGENFRMHLLMMFRRIHNARFSFRKSSVSSLIF
ncbi:CC chemokine receptor-like protein [Moosepox virus GoldyGopher14]|nr:CC chemokine receptor-like protein [Moosepox virus GoldyGopher14]